MFTKYDEHVSKECPWKLSSFMELLKHLAKHHHDNKRVVQSKVSEDDFLLKKKKGGTFWQGKNCKVKGDKDSRLIFEESILNEFLEIKLQRQVKWQEGKTSDSLLATLVASASEHQLKLFIRQLAV